MKLSLIFGGKSYEHEISIVSAISLSKILEITHFIFLDYEHQFFLIPKEKMKSNTFSSGAYKQCKKLMPTYGDFVSAGFLGDKKLGVERVLSVVHGGDGEDGVLSSLLEFYRIPFIAPRKEACILSYDKELTKLYAQSRGVKVLGYEVFSVQNPPISLKHYPAIIKPSRLGSSIGVNVVRDEAGLAYGLDCAFEYDDRIIVEPFVEGVREYNLAGYRDHEGKIVFSIVEEPKKADFLNFENKYLDFSRTEQVLRAEISEALEQSLRENFIKLYENCFEGAIIRCDFFVIDGEVYLNEINPIPGSMANYLFEDFSSVVAGISLPLMREISGNYAYIHKIQRAKGKA
ncbi:D-alanine--D-alanine ligase [Helicobacter pametensis]|uniref:D-alanine--D-alanine ligase n=1 Tax=Helicobacter pametensis TaxID=95149 RepID=UPI0004847D7D|nr:D-alanine--D-alanine ligase [Helicobacter pametensis]